MHGIHALLACLIYVSMSTGVFLRVALTGKIKSGAKMV